MPKIHSGICQPTIACAVDSDVVTLHDPANGTCDNRSFEAGKLVSVSVLSIASATHFRFVNPDPMADIRPDQ